MKNIIDIPMLLKRELMSCAIEQFVDNILRIDDDSKYNDAFDPDAAYDVEEILNNAYMNRDEIPLAMDIFKPKVSDKVDLPVITLIHGGGLVVGDRRISRKYARLLAARGYLVFTIEYRLTPHVNIAEQLDDVCAGMDCLGKKLIDFNVDFNRTYIVAESAGAFLAIYVAAMKKSRVLQEAIGYKPTRMMFKAIGVISGMFYTNKSDPIGFLLSDQYYGDKRMDKEFLQYMNPEHPEIIDNMPPIFMITSRGDFLNNYSIMYHKAMKNAGKESHLLYYGEKDLIHSFACIFPYNEKSLDATGRMLDWFEKISGESCV